MSEIHLQGLFGLKHIVGGPFILIYVVFLNILVELLCQAEVWLPQAATGS